MKMDDFWLCLFFGIESATSETIHFKEEVQPIASRNVENRGAPGLVCREFDGFSHSKIPISQQYVRHPEFYSEKIHILTAHRDGLFGREESSRKPQQKLGKSWFPVAKFSHRLAVQAPMDHERSEKLISFPTSR